jgi:hypothetical protein
MCKTLWTGVPLTMLEPARGGRPTEDTGGTGLAQTVHLRERSPPQRT